MDFNPITSPPIPTERHHVLMAKAKELEASFLAEMLAHSGLGGSGFAGTESGFDGGAGEVQFSSFLRQEQARLMVDGGGIGLAEMIFKTMAEAEHADRT